MDDPLKKYHHNIYFLILFVMFQFQILSNFNLTFINNFIMFLFIVVVSPVYFAPEYVELVGTEEKDDGIDGVFDDAWTFLNEKSTP